ncbi:UxaA family hydrolase [Alteromonas lipolytica]|uniref:Altronate hydrolase n=1 Tax=Alteromonas lipolytica TaxID=1856405 RepID=A0A1E8FHZ5_9ALTE|nr:altronate dehydratase family protein [Alteromonas lipolytica]OFI35560.1 altronate hydrolase [Alteromonas lipolytica]GGF77193.1 altronate hydrolase [Alteromonas lipolytica]
MAEQTKLIQVHPNDNVAVSTMALAAGTVVEALSVTLVSDIPAGHKVALKAIPAGHKVMKYGFAIGNAQADIKSGEHVHSHNLKTALSGQENYQYAPVNQAKPVTRPAQASFMGYRRENGKVGIRNEVWIINTVGCVNRTAERIAAECERRFFGECDGFRAFTHPFGCSQLGDDLHDTQTILASLASHPNAGAVLVVGLGCENNQLSSLLKKVDRPASQIRFFNSQQVGDEIEEGIRLVHEMLDDVGRCSREPIDGSELILGMKCGGSDAFSGITANPLVGRMTDLMVRQNGSVLLTETPEMFGAEQLLMNRATSMGVFSDIVELVNDFKQYFIDNNQPVYENPSPGNKAGGLTTLEEKSLGAVQKGGQAAVNGVLQYGEPLSHKGLNLLQAPGNDAVSSTALAASGAHIILFTTGRGTPLGFPVPTVKISSNSEIARKKPHWIDFNAGQILEGTSIDDCAAQLYQHCLNIASGEKTCNEKNGSHEIAIWKRGVTL